MPEQLTLDERRARGTQSRTQTPRASHAGWTPATGRPSPVALLKEQETTREPDLIPVRHGRMMVSPFTFYRGAAKIMAEDLKDTGRRAAGQDGQAGGKARGADQRQGAQNRQPVGAVQGRDANDPLFLQVKEATSSVLEAHLPRSKYRQHGQRVVQGQRLMQAVSDIYLGWTRGVDVSRHFYWRQMRDMKGSISADGATPLGLQLYARLCGWTMARAHARSGDPVAIAAYLGTGDAFDRSITDFAHRYADQNERDYEEFVSAVKDGRLDTVEGV